jgi:hypothetical protein
MALDIGSGTAVSAYQTNSSSLAGRKGDHEPDALSRALQAGDLNAAKEAFDKLATRLPAGVLSDPNNPLTKVGKALQGDDIEAARAAMAGRSGYNDRIGTTGSVSKVKDSNKGYQIEVSNGMGQALQLSSAINSGNAKLAKALMQQMFDELQQMAAMNSASPTSKEIAIGKPLTGNKSLASAISSADKLLSNPDFQSLKRAVDRGDLPSMQAAWAAFIRGSIALREKEMDLPKSADTPKNTVIGFSRSLVQAA